MYDKESENGEVSIENNFYFGLSGLLVYGRFRVNLEKIFRDFKVIRGVEVVGIFYLDERLKGDI